MENAAAAFDVAQPFHTFIVFKHVIWVDGEVMIEFATASGGPYLSTEGVDGDINMHAGSDTAVVNIATGTFALLQSFFDNTNSFQAVYDDAPVTGTAGTKVLANGIRLANWHSNILEANVSFADIAIFDAEITGDALASLKTYYKARYNLW